MRGPLENAKLRYDGWVREVGHVVHGVPSNVFVAEVERHGRTVVALRVHACAAERSTERPSPGECKAPCRGVKVIGVPAEVCLIADDGGLDADGIEWPSGACHDDDTVEGPGSHTATSMMIAGCWPGAPVDAAATSRCAWSAELVLDANSAIQPGNGRPDGWAVDTMLTTA